ncbi:hypothetical protein [Streptomyces sp. I8-5]|uniref:DUF7341 domain-containing protein n=1 Tax=Streptomyces sp. I8-5 TaxID=3104277 RepID=UPI003868C218
MSATDAIRDHVRQLCDGYEESVTYGPAGAQNTRRVHFKPLLDQLSIAAREQRSMKPSGGSNPNKSSSRPPLNQAFLDMLDDIRDNAIRTHQAIWLRMRPGDTEVPHIGTHLTIRAILREIHRLSLAFDNNDPVFVETIATCVESWVRASKVLLGHESRIVILVDTVCGAEGCGAPLQVALDATSNVSCTKCPTTYEQHSWAEMLDAT